MSILDFIFKRRISFRKTVLSSQAREIVKTKWQEIEELIKLGKPSNFKNAVISADKLLYFVLKEVGFSGTLGEKLIAAKGRFSDYSGIWQAHKLRNRIVHEIEHEMFHFEATSAVAQFKKALKDLSAL